MKCSLTDVEPLGRDASAVCRAVFRHRTLYRGRIYEIPLVMAPTRPAEDSFFAFSAPGPVKLTKQRTSGGFLLADVVI